MENLSLLSLLVLLAAWPLVATAWSSDTDDIVAATWSSDSDIEVVLAWSDSGSGARCGGSSRSYGANSTYEANLHHLAAVLPAAASAAHGHSVDGAIGYWPNRVQTSATCWSGDDGDCATCIAEAFKKVERECPFRREASFFGHDCYLRFAEFRIFSSTHGFGRNTMFEAFVMGMMFQAFGLACIFFLFIQAWRHDTKKGTMTRHTPLRSGDQ